MSSNEGVGSGWDYMLSAIINSVKSRNAYLLDGCHELEAIQKILTVPEIRYFDYDNVFNFLNYFYLNVTPDS